MEHTPTLAARLTAEIPAAIATIAVHGPQAVNMVEKFLIRKSGDWPIGTIRYAEWRLSTPSTQVAEQVVVCRTKENTVEVHCHGGMAVCRAILNCLDDAGCEIVSQHQWHEETPLQHNWGPQTSEQAAHDLLQATTDRSAGVLLDQMSGALDRAFAEIQRQRAAGDRPAALQGLHELLGWAEFGLHLANPWRIVLAGPPNVGKSSLMNSLVGRQQAIVHHEPGTTRDWIECRGAIAGWPVAFTDTAGVRTSDDAIEQQGVERSWQRLREADLVVIVVDAVQGWTDMHTQLLQASPEQTLVVWNKVDLVVGAEEGLQAFSPGQTHRTRFAGRQNPIATSNCSNPGVVELLDVLAKTLVPREPKPGTAVPFRQQHVRYIEQCLHELNE